MYSTQSGVDPVGSCVGQKGVRVQGVIGELGGMEKVDIIQWSDDAKQFITSALAPAKDLDVILNTEKKEAQVLVPDDQLSLAIGRDGQNVRIAAKLTGWKIDIKGKGLPAKAETSDKGQETSVGKPESTSAKVSEGKEPTAAEQPASTTQPVQPSSPAPETPVVSEDKPADSKKE